MAKRIIRTGTTADPTGDSLKNAFTKVNDNFTELYNALGLDADTLNIGAFEFSGSVMTTTDSSAIVIDQATTVTSNLTVGGDILPQTANGGDLGSSTNPWRSLYVSNNTIYINNVPLGLNNSNNLTINGTPISQTIAYTDIPNAPTDIADLTDLTSLLSAGTGDIGFENNYIYHTSNGDIWIDPSNDNGSTGYIVVPGPTNANTNPLIIDNQMAGGIQFGTNGSYWTLDSDGWLNVIGNRGLRSQEDEDLAIQIRDSDNDDYELRLEVLDNADEVRSRITQRRNRVQFGFNLTTSPVYYEFLSTGETRVPGDIQGPISGSWNIYKDYIGNGEYVSLAARDNTATVQSAFRAGDIDAVITTGAGTKTWTFSNDGNLTIPGDIRSESDINIEINLSDSTLRRWTFGEDGDLTLPRGYIKPDETTGFLRIEGPLTANMVGDGMGYATISNGVEILTHRAFTDTEHRFRFAWDGALYMPTDSSNSQVGAIEWRNVAAATALIKTVQGDGTRPDGLHLYTYGANSGTTIESASTQKKWVFRDDGNLTIPGDIKSEGNINIDINLSDSTLRRWRFGEDGELTFPDASVQTTAWTGTLTINDSGLTINGGTGTIYQGPSGALQAGDKKGGVYHATSTSSNGLFTFGINGGGIMSAAVEGSLFVGTSMPSNNGGVTTAYGGWLVVENGGKFGTDVDTLGNVILGKGVFEKFQTKTDATGTVEHDCINGHIFYHTSPDANWTANFTNLNIAVSYATSVTIVITQGGTGYYPNAVQIGGVGQTINWQGNATPTPSTNRTDVVTFSIINNAGTYIVLGQLTGF